MLVNSDEPVGAGTLTPLAVDLPTGAWLAGVGFTKFRELVAANEIPTVTIGTRRLVRVAAVAAFLERLEAEGSNGTPTDVGSTRGFAARVAARRAPAA